MQGLQGLWLIEAYITSSHTLSHKACEQADTSQQQAPVLKLLIHHIRQRKADAVGGRLFRRRRGRAGCLQHSAQILRQRDDCAGLRVIPSVCQREPGALHVYVRVQVLQQQIPLQSL